MEGWERQRRGEVRNEKGEGTGGEEKGGEWREEREWTPNSWFTPMFEILKNTLPSWIR